MLFQKRLFCLGDTLPGMPTRDEETGHHAVALVPFLESRLGGLAVSSVPKGKASRVEIGRLIRVDCHLQRRRRRPDLPFVTEEELAEPDAVKEIPYGIALAARCASDEEEAASLRFDHVVVAAKIFRLTSRSRRHLCRPVEGGPQHNAGGLPLDDDVEPRTGDFSQPLREDGGRGSRFVRSGRRDHDWKRSVAIRAQRDLAGRGGEHQPRRRLQREPNRREQSEKTREARPARHHFLWNDHAVQSRARAIIFWPDGPLCRAAAHFRHRFHRDCISLRRSSPSANVSYVSVMNSALESKHGETQAHRDLKRLALIWAQSKGFRTAAAEVSIPNFRVRMDVAAYKPQRVRETQNDPGTEYSRAVWKPVIGSTASFECTASQTDFIRDARSMKAVSERLKVLQERKEKAEQELRIHPIHHSNLPPSITRTLPVM